LRKKVIRAAKKVKRKAKKKRRRSSSTGSSSTSSSSSSTEELMLDTEVLEGQRENLRLWRRTRGALALGTILEAQQTLLTRQGVHPDVQSGELPPVMVQYFKNHLQPVMTPAVSRESHHWAMLLDLLIKGEIARAADLGCQRLKSLEGYAKGVTLDVARNLELVPLERTSLASPTETMQTGRVAAEELKIAQRTRYTLKWGEPSGSYQGGGKKGKTKGEGKKGRQEGKGKKGKEDEKDKAS
jgi:hypothetical protein